MERARKRVRTLTTQHGPEHPDVFAAQIKLLTLTSEAGLRHTLVAPSKKLFSQAGEALGPEHPLTLTLGHEYAEALGAVSRDVESLKLHQEIHELRMKALGPDHKDTLESLDSIGARHRALSDGPAALSIYKRLYHARLRLSGPGSRETLIARNGVGMALSALGRNDEAIELYEDLLPAAECIFDAGSPLVLSFRNNYANALGAVRRYAESAALHRQVYGERLRTSGAGQPSTLRSATNLCLQLRELGEYQEAIGILKEAIDAASRILGSRHSHVTEAKLELVAHLWQSGSRQEALEFHSKISEDCVEAYGAAHPTTLFCQESLAERLVATDRTPAATALRRRIHGAAMDAFDDRHLMRFWAHHILASGLSWAKEHQECLEYALLAADGRRRLLGDDHQGTVDSETVVAHALGWLKQHRQAADQYGYVAGLLAKRRGESDRAVIKNRWSAARQLFKGGEQESALPVLHNVLQTQIAAYGEIDGESLKMLSLYARTVYEAGDWESALELTACWVDRVESSFGISAPQTIDALTVLAEWCEGLEVPDQAVAARHRLLQAWRLATGPDSKETMDAETSVIAAHMMFGDTRKATQAATSFDDNRRQRLGHLHEKALESQATLARLLELQGEWAALISLRRQALDRVQAERSDSRIIRDHQFALADALASAGKDDEAIARFNLLLEGRKAAVGFTHPETVPIRQFLARLYLRSDKPDDAVPHYEALILAQLNIDGSDTPESLESRMELAHLQQELGSFEANNAFRSIYELAQQLVPDDVRLLAARNDYARSLYEEDRRDEAFELLRWNVVESTRLLGEEHSDTIRIRCSLASALLDDGQAWEASGILEAAVDDHARTGGGLNSVLPMLRTLAEALRECGRPEHVPAAYRRVLGILSEQLPFPDHFTDPELSRTLPDPFRYEDAIELERLNVAELHSTYGHHHPETRAATDQLVKTLQAVLLALSGK